MIHLLDEHIGVSLRDDIYDDTIFALFKLVSPSLKLKKPIIQIIDSGGGGRF